MNYLKFKGMKTVISVTVLIKDTKLKTSSTLVEQSVLLTQYFSGDKIEKNELSGACSAYGGEERHILGFGGET